LVFEIAFPVLQHPAAGSFVLRVVHSICSLRGVEVAESALGDPLVGAD